VHGGRGRRWQRLAPIKNRPPSGPARGRACVGPRGSAASLPRQERGPNAALPPLRPLLGRPRHHDVQPQDTGALRRGIALGKFGLRAAAPSLLPPHTVSLAQRPHEPAANRARNIIPGPFASGERCALALCRPKCRAAAPPRKAPGIGLPRSRSSRAALRSAIRAAPRALGPFARSQENAPGIAGSAARSSALGLGPSLARNGARSVRCPHARPPGSQTLGQTAPLSARSRDLPLLPAPSARLPKILEKSSARLCRRAFGRASVSRLRNCGPARRCAPSGPVAKIAPSCAAGPRSGGPSGRPCRNAQSLVSSWPPSRGGTQQGRGIDSGRGCRPGPRQVAAPRWCAHPISPAAPNPVSPIARGRMRRRHGRAVARRMQRPMGAEAEEFFGPRLRAE
jgi:hypothetical protein